MFNFFGEIKQNVKDFDGLDEFNIINLSGKLLYAEGHKGLVTLSKELISFRVKRAVIMVEGQNMTLLELSENTIKVGGKITKIEQV